MAQPIDVTQKRPSGLNTTGGRKVSGATSASANDDGFTQLGDWDKETIVKWFQGVCKLSKEQIKILTNNFDGKLLQSLTSSDILSILQITKIGDVIHATCALDMLRTVGQYVKATPVTTLGTQLLAAGKSMDKSPYASVINMASALTQAVVALDASPPANTEGYLAARANLVENSRIITEAVKAAENPSRENPEFVKQAKDFVRLLLPTLQKLRALTAASKSDSEGSNENDTKVHTATIQAHPLSSGVSLSVREDGVIFVREVSQGSPAEKTGMVKVGDEVLMINGQPVIGWRISHVESYFKRCQPPMMFKLKITLAEFDARIAHIMQQARKIRDSVRLKKKQGRATAALKAQGQLEPVTPKPVATKTEVFVPQVSIDCAPEPTHTSTQQRRSSATTNITSMQRESLSVIMRNKMSIETSGSRVSVYDNLGMMAGPDEEQECTNEVTIDLPRDGDQWCAGTYKLIEWSSSLPKTELFDIILVPNGMKGIPRDIAAGVMNFGMLGWSIPENSIEGTYKIMVMGAGNTLLGESGVITINYNNSDNVNFLDAARVAIIDIPDGSHGFQIDGAFVSFVAKGGPADTQDGLQLGDQIIEINGTSTCYMCGVELANFIESSSAEGATLNLVVVNNLEGYKQFMARVDKMNKSYRETLAYKQIELPPSQSGARGLGINLEFRNGLVVVGDIIDGSLASSAAGIQTGQVLLQVNRCKLDFASRHQILAYMETIMMRRTMAIVTTAEDAAVEYMRSVASLRKFCEFTPNVCQNAMSRLQNRNKNLRRSSSFCSEGSSNSLKESIIPGRSLSYCQKPSSRPLDANVLTPCRVLTNPDCEGFLVKLGGSGFTPKNWRRRYFVLKQGTCFYYKEPSDDEALGAFRLAGYMIMPPDRKKRMHNKFGFKVHKKGFRSYYLCADDMASMKRWMNAMSLAAIQYHQSHTEKVMQEDFEQVCQQKRSKNEHGDYLSPLAAVADRERKDSNITFC